MPFDRPAIFRPDPFEEFQRIAADHFLLTVVGPAEAARHHAAKMTAGFEEGHVQSFTARRDRADHSARCAAVHHQIEGLRRTGGLVGVHECEREHNR
jgi:hypothetical protein